MVHPATAPQNASSIYDFIVVGGGTAGCVVAGRLAENPKVSILVVEAGPNNTAEIPEINTPARAFELRGGPWDWKHKTTMIDRPDYTRVEKPNPRGKVLGGSSAENYYTWVRGSAATIDDWAEYATDEWNWVNTKQYFDKSATYHDDEQLYPAELAKTLNRGGPLHVAHADLIPEMKPFRNALESAWTSKGEELSADVWNGTQKGLFRCVSTIYKGLRSNASVFVEGKENITVVSSTYSKNLVFEGKKAVGVTVIGADGKEYTFKAKNEVIVSQGAYGSPHLLMLSGIGRKADLEAMGVKVVVDSEHVGQNLLDHPIFSHVFKLKDGYSLDSHLLRAGPQKDGALSTYRKDKSGPMGSGLLELVAFPRADKWFESSKEYREYKTNNGGVDPFGPAGQPHFEVDFVPMFCDPFQWHFPTPPTGDYLTVIVDLMRPLSRSGTVKLQSTNPFEQPHINLNFFSEDLDIIALREGVRMIDDIILNGDGMKDIIDQNSPLFGGPDYPWPLPRNSDAAMNRQILERSQTGFHPCGSCRFGKDIKQGVVDPKLQVHGTEGLRVIDASVFPVIPDCRIQNDVYMVAEKGADIIKAAYPDLY